ncbi:MAG: hypothetical protein AB7H77_01870 [Bdellovibrionales bacterium]
MGLARGAIALLLEEAHKRPFCGRLATLGRQTIYTSAAEIARQFDKFHVKPRRPIDPHTHTVSDQDVFGWMGFDRVESLDYSDFEGATHVVDLNKDLLPPGLSGGFDVVLDSGTLEHVFHLPNAIKNTLSLLKIGGRMIFLTPSSNHLDHGFYMFSPTLFADYFAANGFRIEALYVVRYSGDLDVLWDAYAYEPGKWRDMHIGGLDDRPYAIWAVATRLENSTLDVIPQQGYYADSSSAYGGSRLATGAVAEVGTEQPAATVAPDTQAPHTPAHFSPARHLLRNLARRLPGARPAWRIIRAHINRWVPHGTKAAMVFAPSHHIFTKKCIGKF